MHLEIKLTKLAPETVDSAVVNKLYDLYHNRQSGDTFDLLGYIKTGAIFRNVETELETAFLDLEIEPSEYYIVFADPEVVRVLTAKGVIEEGEGLTTAQAAVATVFREIFKNNTTVKNFDELRYFDKYKTTGGSGTQQIFDEAVNLESVDLTGIKSTGLLYAFRKCHSLEWYHGKSGPKNVLNLQWRNVSSIQGSAFYENYGLHEVTSLGATTILENGCFQSCTNLTTIDISNIITIGLSVFELDANLEYFNGSDSTARELNLPNLTGTLGSSAFKGCTKLTSISSLGGVTSIGNNAFENCSSLATINFPSTITSVGGNAFNNTAWYNNKPDGEVIIGSCLYKYKGTAVGTYTIPSNITSVTASCFYGQSSLTGITSWPSSQNTIPNACFQNSGLESFDLTNIVTIEGNAFRNSKLTSIVIPNSVTSLGNDCFSQCSDLTSITIGTGVTALGRSIFSFCPSIETLVIPSNVKSLERDTLTSCIGLQWVRLESTTMVSLNNASCFYNTNNCIIYVPSDLVDIYKADSIWSSLASRIQAIPNS